MHSVAAEISTSKFPVIVTHHKTELCNPLRLLGLALKLNAIQHTTLSQQKKKNYTHHKRTIYCMMLILMFDDRVLQEV